MKMEKLDSFDEGMIAAREGTEHWVNPHCSPTGSIKNSQAWYAGWCFEKKNIEIEKVSDGNSNT
jgi:hypothetical protein